MKKAASRLKGAQQGKRKSDMFKFALVIMDGFGLRSEPEGNAPLLAHTPFLDRLLNVALPRVRDFRGLSPNSFDGRGNYSLGLDDHLVFPELGYDDVERVRGMDITIVTTAKTDEEAGALLELLGLPVQRPVDAVEEAEEAVAN